MRIKDGDEFPMILIGNKCDLQRQRLVKFVFNFYCFFKQTPKKIPNLLKVSNENVDEIKTQLKLPYLETSAKTRQNVDEAFYELVRLIRNYQLKERPPLSPNQSEKKRRLTHCNLL